MLSFLAAAESYQLPAASHARGCAIGVDCRRGAIASMGFLDGAKAVFAGDKPVVAADRVTPFDRWLGIDVRSDESQGQAEAFAVPDDFVDSMDESNYVFVDLPKPMGIVFEENDPGTGGVFVASLAEGGAAEADASLKAGDQLVAVAGTTVKGAVDNLDRILRTLKYARYAPEARSSAVLQVMLM